MEVALEGPPAQRCFTYAVSSSVIDSICRCSSALVMGQIVASVKAAFQGSEFQTLKFFVTPEHSFATVSADLEEGR